MYYKIQKIISILMKRIYMDGVFDLFHIGHLEAIKKCKELGDFIIIGVVSDNNCMSYKRSPIIGEKERVEIIKNIKLVDQVIEDCPLIITKEFIDEYKIDLVVHGFSNEDDYEKQKIFFDIPIKLNKFKMIKYYNKSSTTEIIDKIKLNY